MNIEAIMKAFANDEFCVRIRSVDDAEEFIDICHAYGFSWWWEKEGYKIDPWFTLEDFDKTTDAGIVIYGHDFNAPYTMGWNIEEDHQAYKPCQPVIMYEDIKYGHDDAEIILSCDDPTDLLR